MLKKYKKPLNVINLFFFLKKLFLSFSKKGNKYFIYKIFLRVYNLVLKMSLQSSSKFSFLYFFNNVYIMLNPHISSTSVMFKRKRLLLPTNIINKKRKNIKNTKMIIAWVKISIYKRPEKTFFLKFFSELKDIRLNKGGSINYKKEYINTLIMNKYYLKFLKIKKWI